MTEMPTNPPSPEQQAKAAQHLEQAHQLLDSLRRKLDKHPELEDAILKIETALNMLTVSTGGML
jgi:predicted translin family RNA/ssDNA-binding protein